MEQEVDIISAECALDISENSELASERRGELLAQIEAMQAATFKRVALPMGVEVIAAELHEGTAAKTRFQEVCVTLKNTGKTPVVEIWGEIETFDANGRHIKKLDKKCIFSADNTWGNLKPGATWKCPEARGKWVWDGVDGIGLEGEKATTCKIKITKVIHEQSANK
jgi:hypothetical protein